MVHRAGAPQSDTPVLYGLDIETDTASDGLDPARSRIVSAAISAPDVEVVVDGPEPELLVELDRVVRALPPGVLVTWNGARFDLPFLADRARRCEVSLGLSLRLDLRLRSGHPPLPGHEGGYRASWYGHRHLDAYPVYRADVGATLGVSCALKNLARFVGLPVIEVDRRAVHTLDPGLLRAYVASDARLARQLAERRMGSALAAVDDPEWVRGG